MVEEMPGAIGDLLLRVIINNQVVSSSNWWSE